VIFVALLFDVVPFVDALFDLLRAVAVLRCCCSLFVDALRYVCLLPFVYPIRVTLFVVVVADLRCCCCCDVPVLLHSFDCVHLRCYSFVCCSVPHVVTHYVPHSFLFVVVAFVVVALCIRCFTFIVVVVVTFIVPVDLLLLRCSFVTFVHLLLLFCCCCLLLLITLLFLCCCVVVHSIVVVDLLVVFVVPVVVVLLLFVVG